MFFFFFIIWYLTVLIFQIFEQFSFLISLVSKLFSLFLSFFFFFFEWVVSYLIVNVCLWAYAYTLGCTYTYVIWSLVYVCITICSFGLICFDFSTHHRSIDLYLICCTICNIRKYDVLNSFTPSNGHSFWIQKYIC